MSNDIRDFPRTKAEAENQAAQLDRLMCALFAIARPRLFAGSGLVIKLEFGGGLRLEASEAEAKRAIESAVMRRGLTLEYLREIRAILDAKPIEDRFNPDLYDMLEAVARVIEAKGSEAVMAQTWEDIVKQARPK